MMLKPALRPPLRAPMRGATTLREGGGFSLAAFMASQTDGLWFDTTKTDRFFQENTGPTLADDVGEVMGLALDQRLWSGQTLAQVLAAQAEVNSNPGGPFSAATGWANTSGVSVSVSGGKLRLLSTINGVSARASDLALSGLTVGATYAFRALANPIGGPGALTVPARIGARNNASSASLMDGNADGSWYYFVATEVNNKIRLRWDGDGSTTTATYVDFDYAVVRLVPGNHGIQATGSLKPVRQTTGAKFDGSDDNWLTPYLYGAAPNFLVILLTDLGPGGQVIAGSIGAASGRFYLTVKSGGNIGGGCGTQNDTVIASSGPDRRGQTVVAGISCDGSTVRLFDDQAIGYEAAQSGSPNTTIPVRIGCLNNNGTASNFFGGSVKKLVAGREFLSLSRYLQIRSQLLAS